MYIYDIVVYATTLKLKAFFDRLKTNQLQLQNPASAKESLMFMSCHKWTQSPAKSRNNRSSFELSQTSSKHIKQFLGFAGYYRRFVKDFSKVALLLKKDTSFVWSDQQPVAFDTVNLSLMQYIYGTRYR